MPALLLRADQGVSEPQICPSCAGDLEPHGATSVIDWSMDRPVFRGLKLTCRSCRLTVMYDRRQSRHGQKPRAGGLRAFDKLNALRAAPVGA